tara:strand:- start:136 stop:648 length:513 start_codon:yes stop_codon:yes gene_type:complete
MDYVFYVKVAGGKFVIDGYSQQALDLGHNITYKFDQSDSSNGGHPLRLSTTSDGTYGGGSAYTTGVTTAGSPGSSGAYTQIAVTSSTAAALYYYCSNHSGMGGVIATTGDEYATTSRGFRQPILGNAIDTWGNYSNQTVDLINAEFDTTVNTTIPNTATAKAIAMALALG